MQRILLALILLFFIAVLSSPFKVEAGFFGSDTLVSIDGDDYTTDDFKHWWEFWKDEGSSLPETPEPYIDWLLLSREGRRMELDTDPGFKRGTRVFLQSRTLLKLKYEAVDSQIKVTDADVKRVYNKDYVPRWELVGMEFKDNASAATVWQELNSGSVTLESLLERDPQLGGPIRTSQMWMRPKSLEKNEKWRSIYNEMSPGQVVDPSKIGESKVLWYLRDKKGGDDEDFSKERENIQGDLRAEQEKALTRKLLDDLRSKYEAQVNEERLDAIDLTADDATFTDDPVITTNQQNVSEKEFVAVMRRLLSTRPMMSPEPGDVEAMKQLKRDTAFNVIAQSVTNWESLDRHYEEKEPFKWEYEFNYNHRLVLAVEQRMFADQVVITEEDIKQQYEQNKSRYSVPSTVKLYIIDETQGPLDQVWADIAIGESIDKVLKKHFEKHPGLQEIPFNHLDPEVKTVVAGLSEGETSQIFTAQGIRVLVHLSERSPEAPIPFERVKESIRQELFYKKIDQLQKVYLDNIKSSSEIEVQQRQWKTLYKELGGR